MIIALSTIIEEAMPFVEKQVGDVFDKYSIERISGCIIPDWERNL